MTAHSSCLFFLLMLAALTTQAQPGIGQFDDHSDVGQVQQPGTVQYDPVQDSYTVSGSGANVWFDHDEFHYLWKRLEGDFILHARASLVGEQGDPHCKLGWMVRSGLQADASHVSAVLHADGLTALQYRDSAGADTKEVRAEVEYADVIELERKGNTFIMRVAPFGEPYTTEEISTIDLDDEVYVGLFVTAHQADTLVQGTFDNVRISVPATENLVPYREYLGSRIEILDVSTGDREVVYTSPNSLQAPNWTADGKALLYNSEGLIYRLDLSTSKASVLNTGDVKNNNNDHVLSFDGQMLGLSSGVEKLGGSIIYTVPVEGGQPKQVTPRGPSYLHGWSPDGQHLVFTGQRHGDFDIYQIPADGGPETRLTTTQGLDDGPEYSPDGAWIYFNSARSGTMDIWRMKPDGSQPERLTDSAFHDWFPHLSPDGKNMIFLSFLKEEVAADEHPFYKHVYLRMMPANGGKPRVVAYLYGGQGTINTPSWSPDGRKVAFVSNTGKSVLSGTKTRQDRGNPKN